VIYNRLFEEIVSREGGGNKFMSNSQAVNINLGNRERWGAYKEEGRGEF